MRPPGRRARVRLTVLVVAILVVVVAGRLTAAALAAPGMATQSGPTTTVAGTTTATNANSAAQEPTSGAATGGAASSGAAITGAAPAQSAAAPLTVTVDRPLTSVTQSLIVTVTGDLGTSLLGAKLVVRVKGPVEASQIAQIGAGGPDLHEANKIVVALGTSAATSTTSSITTTTAPATINAEDELGAGTLTASVPLPPGTPGQAGAYLVVAEIKSGSDVIASGQAWIGKAASRQTPLDLAFVWPVSLGIHRDPAGTFFDTVIEDSLTTSTPDAGSLGGLAGIADRFPSWNFTLAVEPVLLTQLRDMADGYALANGAGATVQVPAGDSRAQSAGSVLAALSKEAGQETVEIAVTPYAGADLALLAAQGWRDGFEQIQLGKEELQDGLGLSAPLTGACSPDLSLTSSGLASYADASIDHVVVDSKLAAMLTEEIDPGAVSVRARNDENARVTLLLADDALGSQLASPWDPGRFFAAVAAELAATPRSALIVAPKTAFSLVPDSFIESVGRALSGLDWVRTDTLSEILRRNSPGTRPIMLKTATAAPTGYIESSLLDDLRSAHSLVTDLSTIADPTRSPLQAANTLLYVAESRWWWRSGTSPAEATTGLAYALEARKLAKAELDKVTLVKLDSGLIAGSHGSVAVTLENKATYAVKASLELNGTGLSLPGGPKLDVELPPGRTITSVKVAATAGEHILDARLMAGTSVLDEISHPVTFLTVKGALPFIVVGGLALAAGLYFLIRRLLRGRKPGVTLRWIGIQRRR